ncbi:MAG: transcriptional repressor NrdR [Bdellovibrionales bacterium]|nr:transcriptional repressor NrdR [Bdellovibrionales bacterium]
MNCPYCQSVDTKVLETRSKQDNTIKRRRKCLSCHEKFNTVERVTFHYPNIIKKDGSVQPYLPSKLRKGLEYACQKRPIKISQIESIITKISKTVEQINKREISSQIIGQLVLKELKELDQAAFVRFASVYRSFDDIQEFVAAIKTDNLEISYDQ